MCVSTVRKVLEDLKPKASVLPRLSKAAEDMFLRCDAAAWIDVQKVGAILKAGSGVFSSGFLPYFVAELFQGGERGNPLANLIRWFRMTRAGVLTSAEQWAFALSLPPQGPVLEARGSYPEGSPVAKAISGAKGAEGPLTAALPDKPFIFAYGIRKDLFSTPAELKKKAVAAIVEGNSLDPATPEMKRQVGDMILAVHEQVTEVQHWAGPVREDGPMAIASVIRCRDAEALRKTVKDNVPAFQTLLNLALGMLGGDEDNRFTLSLEEANEPPEGQVKADAILASHPMLDKMAQEEGEMLRKVLLGVFPGESKFRARLAVVDPKTLVVTIGGGRRFLTDAVAAAKAGASKAEQGDDAKAALAMLPANRFTVAMVSVTGAAGLYGSAMMLGGMGIGGGARIHFPSAPPLAVALSAERGELVITAHIPSAMLKRMIGITSGGGDVPEEDEENVAPTTRPAPRETVGGIRVERRTAVEDVTVEAPKNP